jgi:hypothetical protein
VHPFIGETVLKENEDFEKYMALGYLSFTIGLLYSELCAESVKIKNTYTPKTPLPAGFILHTL